MRVAKDNYCLSNRIYDEIRVFDYDMGSNHMRQFPLETMAYPSLLQVKPHQLYDFRAFFILLLCKQYAGLNRKSIPKISFVMLVSVCLEQQPA